MLDLRLYARNPGAILWTFFFPTLLLGLLLLSYGSERHSVGRISVEVVDNDGTAASESLVRTIADALGATPGLEASVSSTRQTDPLSRAQIRLSVPNGFGLGLAARHPPQLTVRYVDDHSYVGHVGKAVLEAAIIDFVSREDTIRRPPASAFVEQIVVEGLPYPTFLLTGCTVVLMYSTCLFGFAVPLVGIRSSGIVRMFNIFPLSPIMHIKAILAGRAIIILVTCSALFAFGVLTFQVPIALTLSALAAYLALFLIGAIVFLSFGLALASQARTVGRAMLFANLIYYPVIFASDLFVPSRALPDWITRIASLFPVGELAELLRLASQDKLSVMRMLGPAVYFGLWTAGCALLIRPNGLWHSEHVDFVSRLLNSFKRTTLQRDELRVKDPLTGHK